MAVLNLASEIELIKDNTEMDMDSFTNLSKVEFVVRIDEKQEKNQLLKQKIIALCRFYVGFYSFLGIQLSKISFKKIITNQENSIPCLIGNFYYGNRQKRIFLIHTFQELSPKKQILPKSIQEHFLDYYKNISKKSMEINDHANMEFSFPLKIIVGTIANWSYLSKLEVNYFNIQDTKNDCGMLFYNFFRIVSIIATFEQRVKDGIFPELPSLDHPMFLEGLDSLSEGEGGKHLYIGGLILLAYCQKWEDILENLLCLADTNLICNFVKSFNSVLNQFYRTNRVLVDSFAEHDFNRMYWHIYVYKACKFVILELIELLSFGNFSINNYFVN